MNDEVRRELIAFLPRLRRFAHALSGNADDGDDLLQATCERAIRHIDRWQPGTRLDSWMFTIARNLHLNAVRSRGIRGDHLVPADSDREPGTPTDGAAVIESRLTYEAVRRFVGRLPAEQRSILLLVCVEGLSYREVAALMDLPLGTVTSRLARARMTLKALVEEPWTAVRAERAGMEP